MPIKPTNASYIPVFIPTHVKIIAINWKKFLTTFHSTFPLEDKFSNKCCSSFNACPDRLLYFQKYVSPHGIIH